MWPTVGRQAQAQRQAPDGGYPRLVDRGDLLAARDRAAERKVTIISARPAAEDVAAAHLGAAPGPPHRLAVVQVQRDQQDAQLLWLALLDAVHRAAGMTPDEPPTATPTYERAMVDRVLSGLAAHPGPFIVVIDDLHELTSPGSVDQLTDLLTSLPSHVHAVLATRRDLRLRLHRLRLDGELAEPRAADLRFSARQTASCSMHRASRSRRPAPRCCTNGSEGWAAGLRLAAISLRSPRPGTFRRGVLRQRPHGRRVPHRRDAGTPAGRGPGSAAAHLPARSGQRRTCRSADRPLGLGTDLAGPSGRERVWSRSTPKAPGSATTISLPISCGWSSAGLGPKRWQRITGWPPPGSGEGWAVEAIRHTQAASDWPVAARLLATIPRPDARRASADHPGAVAGLPARGGSARTGRGTRHCRR